MFTEPSCCGRTSQVEQATEQSEGRQLPHKPVHSLLASYLSKQAKGSDSSVSSLITPGLWETGHEFQGTSLDR